MLPIILTVAIAAAVIFVIARVTSKKRDGEFSGFFQENEKKGQ